MTALVIDTSALIAIINAEPETIRLLQALTAVDTVYLSFATLHEAHCVMVRNRNDDGPKLLDGLVGRLAPQMVSFDQVQYEIARSAYANFGRGTEHAAGLNLADCYSYALAKSLDVPLLYKGNDFAQTDIRSALAAA